MTLDELQMMIDRTTGQLSAYEEELANLKMQYSALEEFAANSTACANAFGQTIESRKNRLNSFSGLLSTVRSALQYKQIMNDLLTGTEYAKAANAVNEIQNMIARKKDELSGKITQLNVQISAARDQLNDYRYEYRQLEREQYGE